MQNIYEVRASNNVKSGLIVIFFTLFIFTSCYFIASAISVYLGYDPGGWGFLGIAVIVSGISTYISYFYSDKIVLGISGARPANRLEDRLFTSIIENLTLGAGIPKPKLYVIEDSAPNAFATGRDPEHAVVCVTTGLLQKLSRTELEGVLAHELTHIRNYDIRLLSLVSVMVGLVALMADWFLRLSWHGGRGRDRDRGSAVILVLGLIFALVTPLVAQLIQLAISRRREFMADAGGVSLTRQPQGLISALLKISDDPEPLEAANKATAHLYFESPLKAIKNEKGGRVNNGVNIFASLFNTHPPVRERVKLLKAMV